MGNRLRLIVPIALAVCLALPVSSAAAPKTTDGAITGYVLNPDGSPAPGVTVEIWRKRWIGLSAPDWQLAASTSTNRNGKYSVSVAPGTHRVWFVPNDLRKYCMEAYPDAPTPYNGDDVVVAAGRQTGRISIRLDPDPSFIEGHALDVSVQPPRPLDGMLMGPCIQGNSLINVFRFVETDSNGYYWIGGLKAFDWGVVANGMDEQHPQVYPDYEMLIGGLEDWSIDRQGMTETLDFDFQPRGFVNLAGRLVYAGTTEPVAGALVWYMIQEPDGNFYGNSNTFTTVDGRFEFADVWAPAPPFKAGWAVVWVDENMQGLVNSEFFDNGKNEWSARWIPIQRGVTSDIGDWEVSQFTP